MTHYYLTILIFHTEILFKTTKAAIRYMKHLLKKPIKSLKTCTFKQIFLASFCVSFELQTLDTDKYSPLDEEKFEHGSALSKLARDFINTN